MEDVKSAQIATAAAEKANVNNVVDQALERARVSNAVGGATSVDMPAEPAVGAGAVTDLDQKRMNEAGQMKDQVTGYIDRALEKAQERKDTGSLNAADVVKLT